MKLVKEFNKVSDSTFNTSGLAARTTMPFNNRELMLHGKDIYKIMPEDALAIYDEPSFKERGELFVNEFWETWIYDGIELTFWGQTENNKYYGINKVVIKDPDISFVRGTKVGDSLEDVISKFPNENRKIIELYGEKVKTLYGIPIHNHDSGVVKYQDAGR